MPVNPELYKYYKTTSVYHPEEYFFVVGFKPCEMRTKLPYFEFCKKCKGYLVLFPQNRTVCYRNASTGEVMIEEVPNDD